MQKNKKNIYFSTLLKFSYQAELAELIKSDCEFMSPKKSIWVVQNISNAMDIYISV